MQLQLLSVHANGASAWWGNPTSFVRSLQHAELRGEGDAAVHGVTVVETLLSTEEARLGCVKARAAEPAAPALPLQQEGKGFILRVANIPVLQHWLLRQQHQRVFWKSNKWDISSPCSWGEALEEPAAATAEREQAVQWQQQNQRN